MHRLGRLGGRGRADQALDDPQRAVDPVQHPGGGDQVAVVDVADPVGPAHLRVVPAQPDQAQPVRGRRPAIQQAGLGQHFGAHAHAHQQPIALGALALQPLAMTATLGGTPAAR